MIAGGSYTYLADIMKIFSIKIATSHSYYEGNIFSEVENTRITLAEDSKQ